MTEVHGNLWNYYAQPKTVVLITTNGTIGVDGRAIMGKGCAGEARRRFRNIDLRLAARLTEYGNTVNPLIPGIWSFPTKEEWFHKTASPTLIRKSAEQLYWLASKWPSWTFVLPRPGCGSGRLQWSNVEPIIRNLPSNVLVISPNGKE